MATFEENKRLALHYKEKGNKEFSRGNLEEAIKFYSRAIECDDRNEVFYSNRSAVYLKMNLYDEAIQDGKRAIECKPDWCKGYMRLGLAYLGKKNYSDASKQLRMALKFEKGSTMLIKKIREIEKQRPKFWHEDTFVYHDNSHLFRSHPYNQILLKWDQDLKKEEIEKMKFTVEHVPILIDMARDKTLYEMQYKIISNVLEVLKTLPISEEQANSLITFIYLDEKDFDYDTFLDLMQVIGKNALEALRCFALDDSRDGTERSIVIKAIETIGIKAQDEETKTKCIDILMEILQSYDEFDEESNTALCYALSKLKVKEAIPLLREMFVKEMVEEDADWGKVLCEMGEVIPPFDPFVSYCSHCGLADEICSSKMMKENEERAKSEFAAGNECYNNQDYFHALKHFHTAYTCSPDFEEKEKITLKKVNCLVKLKRFDEAIIEHNKIGDCYTKFPELILLGHELREGKYFNLLNMVVNRIAKPNKTIPSVKELKLQWNKLKKKSTSWASTHTDERHRSCFRIINNYFIYTSTCHELGIINLNNLDRCNIQGELIEHCTGFWAKNNELLLASGKDYSICSYDLKSKKLKFTLKGHTQRPYQIECNDDYIISGSNDDTIRIWNKKTLQQENIIYTVNSKFYIYGNSIFVATEDIMIREFDMKTGDIIRGFTESSQNIFVTINDILCNQSFLVCATDNSVLIWNRNGELLHKIFVLGASILSIIESYVACGTSMGEIHLIDLQKGQIEKTFKEHDKSIIGLWIHQSPDKLNIYSAGRDEKIYHIEISIELASLKKIKKICENCKKEEKENERFKICGACKRVAYCSIECQHKHWKEHKPLCKKLKK